MCKTFNYATGIFAFDWIMRVKRARGNCIYLTYHKEIFPYFYVKVYGLVIVRKTFQMTIFKKYK
jgi:hypothetical protein